MVELAQVRDLRAPGPAGDIALRWHDDRPGPARPTLVFYHGGGFVVGDLESHDDLCRRLARASGWAVLAVDYRLAPEARYPAAFDDAYAALMWAAREGGRGLGVDPDRIAVGGDSAGGNLAAAVALAARDRKGPRIAHQLLIYPVIDHDFTTASYLDADLGCFLTAEAMSWFWEQYLGPHGDRADPLAAPGRAADLAGLPPATVVSAGYDPPRDEAKHYAERLEARVWRSCTGASQAPSMASPAWGCWRAGARRWRGWRPSCRRREESTLSPEAGTQAIASATREVSSAVPSRPSKASRRPGSPLSRG